jgi:hypothetical protein
MPDGRVDRYNRYEEEFNNSLSIVLSYRANAKNNEGSTTSSSISLVIISN